MQRPVRSRLWRLALKIEPRFPNVRGARDRDRVGEHQIGRIRLVKNDRNVAESDHVGVEQHDPFGADRARRSTRISEDDLSDREAFRIDADSRIALGQRSKPRRELSSSLPSSTNTLSRSGTFNRVSARSQRVSAFVKTRNDCDGGRLGKPSSMVSAFIDVQGRFLTLVSKRFTRWRAASPRRGLRGSRNRNDKSIPDCLDEIARAFDEPFHRIDTAAAGRYVELSRYQHVRCASVRTSACSYVDGNDATGRSGRLSATLPGKRAYIPSALAKRAANGLSA